MTFLLMAITSSLIGIMAQIGKGRTGVAWGFTTFVTLIVLWVPLYFGTYISDPVLYADDSGWWDLGILVCGIGGSVMAVIVATLPNLKIVDKGGARSETAATGTLVACPFCAEMIKAEAIVCRYCGRDQTSVAASVRTQSGQIPTLSVKDTSRPTSDFSQESEPSRSVVSEPDIGKQQTNSTEPDSDRPGASSEQSASNFRWLWVVGAIAVGILLLTVQQKYKKEPIGVVERPDGLPEQAISQQADPRAMISSTNPAQPSVRHVQALLSELGFDPGPIDGVLGSRTRAAVRAFEIDFGVEPDGTISDLLILRLEMAKEARYGSAGTTVVGSSETLESMSSLQSSETYRRAGGLSSGMVHFVLIPRTHEGDRSPYQAAIQDICGRSSKPVCRIHFWSDPRKVPKNFPMTDDQMNSLLATYGRNKNTGYDAFVVERKNLLIAD